MNTDSTYMKIHEHAGILSIFIAFINNVKCCSRKKKFPQCENF